MSFIVKGIDLPKEGSRMVEIYPDGTASADLGNFYPDMIEAIQIPKDHGRLIDAKLLADTINKAIQDGTFTSKSIWEWIGDAPTIIEAEG